MPSIVDTAHPVASSHFQQACRGEHMIPALKIKNLKLKEVESFAHGLAFLGLEAWLDSLLSTV